MAPSDSTANQQKERVFENFSTSGMGRSLTSARGASCLMALDEGRALWQSLFDTSGDSSQNEMFSSIHSKGRYRKTQGGAACYNYNIRTSLILCAAVHPQ